MRPRRAAQRIDQRPGDGHSVPRLRQSLDPALGGDGLHRRYRPWIGRDVQRRHLAAVGPPPLAARQPRPDRWRRLHHAACRSDRAARQLRDRADPCRPAGAGADQRLLDPAPSHEDVLDVRGADRRLPQIGVDAVVATDTCTSRIVHLHDFAVPLAGLEHRHVRTSQMRTRRGGPSPSARISPRAL